MSRKDQRPEVLVIGSGIVGLATALELARRDLAVAVVTGDHDGSAATTASAGMLAATSESSDNDEPLARIRAEALTMWPEWVEQIQTETSLETGYRAEPTYVPALGDGDHEHLETVARAAAAADQPCEEIDPSSLCELLPELSPKVDRCLVLPDEHRVNPRRLMPALAAALERLGVRVHRRRPVTGIFPGARAVRIAGPGWSLDVARAIAAVGAWTSQVEGLESYPVTPCRGQMIAYDELGWETPCAIRGPRLYAVGRGSSLVLGATEEDTAFDASTTPEARSELATWGGRIFPKLRWKAARRQWAGLRPKCADGLPIVGPTRDDSVWLATGHHRHGILLAPWTARAIAEAIVNGGSLPEELSPRRFDTGPTREAGG